MYLTKKEVAELFKVSERTIERWVKNNDMPHSRVENTLRFDKEEIENWFKNQK